MKACVNCEGRGRRLLRSREEPGARSARSRRRAATSCPGELHPARHPVRPPGLHGHRVPDLRHRLGFEAYLTVSGQNSNNSVARHRRVPARRRDGRRLEPDRAASTARSSKTLKARELWEKIGYAAWASADPGVQFHTTINDWHTCPAAGRDPRLEPVLGVHVPRRHGLQPRLAEPAAVLDRDDRALRRRRATSTPCRLWTIVLEISVMMAQFPSQADRRALLRLPHARPRLRQYRRPADDHRASPTTRAEGRAICGALTAIMTGVAYATSAEMAGELGAFPRLRARTATHMLRVIRNHRRAAHGDADGYERLSHHPGAARPRRTARDADAGRRTPSAAWDQALALGEKHGYRNAQATVIAPDRHDRPRHGLRHHRHRARLRAGEVQEARRRRLLQDHQPGRAGGAAHARLPRGRDRRDRGLCGRPRHARPGARHQPRHAARPRASPTRRSRRSNGALEAAFDIKFVFNQWTLGEDFLHGDARSVTAEQLDRPALRPARRTSASPRRTSRPPTSTSAAR